MRFGGENQWMIQWTFALQAKIFPRNHFNLSKSRHAAMYTKDKGRFALINIGYQQHWKFEDKVLRHL